MTEHKCFVFSFADVKVREREFSIVKAGEVLPVEPKAFRVLLFLLRNPHRLITKDELLDAVWNEVAVSENSLTRSIALLRRLLGDDTHEPRYIATVPTVGYRFLCDVLIEEEGIAQATTADSAQNETEPSAVTEVPAQAATATPPRSWLFYGLIAAVLVLSVAALIRYATARNPDPANTGTQPAAARAAAKDMRILPVTDLPGAEFDPALSPDGEKIAFIWAPENVMWRDLYVQLVGAETPLRLTYSSSGRTCCADWSPDGQQIAFGRCDDNGGGVFTVPALGGPERKLTDVVCPFLDAGYPKWIDDGKSLLLMDSCVPNGPRGIVVFSLETGQKRCLTAPPLYSEQGDFAPALSPDQKTVAFLRSTTVDLAQIYILALSGGSPRQITHEAQGAWGPMWSSDGQHLIFYSGRSGLSRLFHVPAAGGAIEPETVYPGSGSLSHDGRRLVYIPGWQSLVTTWRMQLSNAGGQVISQNKVLAFDGGSTGAQPSPDGEHIVFQSQHPAKQGIWRSDSDGSNPLKLTSFEQGFSGTPRWSPDGKWIVFDHHPQTHAQIYVVDFEGRNQHVITSGNYENVVPSWSRDGKAIYFASNRTGNWQVWKHDLDTGHEKQVTHGGGFAAFESYDGQTLFYSRFEGKGLRSMPVNGGEERQITSAPHRFFWGHFAVTDTGIYLLDSDASYKPTIMFYNFQSRHLTPVVRLKESALGGTANLAASRDGRTVLYTQMSAHSSIVMAENFQ